MTMPYEGRGFTTRDHLTQLGELDSLSTCLPSSCGTSGDKLRKNLRGATHWAAEFDVVSVLGGEGEEGRGDGLGTYGHTGCINALDWSADGSSLASGSDDTRVCIWKLGQEPDSTFPDNPDIVQRYPALGLGLSAVIHTGHRANIFSVKFAPRTTNLLFTASGDHEARVFDLNQASSGAQSFSSPSSHGSIPREWSEYAKTSGVCTRVLKCHRGRVKRIATEGDSDAVFLTCSEDGTVRQHDLRVGHVCKRDCPPPLCSYRDKGMGLYSLTTSILRPELFVVAGTSPYAYLHDRRMVPRTMMEQWGVRASPTEMTQCVRRFGPARPPLVPPPREEPSDDDDIHEDPTNPITRAERMRRARRRQSGFQSEENNHVTAAKLSKWNGRDLLLTYSGGPACLYDIFDDPEDEKKQEDEPTLRSSQNVGKRKADQSHATEGEGTDRQSSNGKEDSSRKSPRIDLKTVAPETQTSQRGKLVLPSPKMAHGNVENGTASPAAPKSDFTASNLEETPGLVREEQPDPGRSTPVYTASATHDAADSAKTARAERQETLRASLLRSPPPASAPLDMEDVHGETVVSPPTHARNFEIRVGEDGNLEMEIEDAEPASTTAGSGGDENADLNTEGYRALLENMAAAAASGHEHGASTEDHEDTDEGEEEQIEDEDDDEDDDDDAISASDDPETLPPSSRTPHSREVPIVRPRKVYKGHRNVDTVKDVNFGGRDNLVLSGSDDGNVFIYNKDTTDIVGIWQGDGSVVNVLQYHPQMPILAVSGIDNSIKILAPTTLGSPSENSYAKRKFSKMNEKDEIMRKNQDTSWTSERLSMPPSILINLLNRAAAAGDDEEEEEGAGPGRRRRIPLSALLQLAGEGDEDQDCTIM